MTGTMSRRWSTTLRERAKREKLGMLFVICRDSEGYEMATERPLTQEQCGEVYRFVRELSTDGLRESSQDE